MVANIGDAAGHKCDADATANITSECYQTDSWWLINARIDKEGMEKLLHELYGVRSPDFNPHSVGPLHPEFVRDRLTIVRPSMLTNGKAGGNMRTSTTTIPSAWTVSRKDVGAFLAGDCLGLAQARTGKPVPGGNGIVLSY